MRHHTVFGLLGALTLTACGSPTPDAATSCMFSVSAPGSYVYPAGPSVPTVTPGEGGTQAGADALNACIRARTSSTTAVTTTQSASVRTSGNTTVKTYSYGSPPAGGNASQGTTTQSRGATAVKGKLPLPSQYPLLPGDAALWNTLTLAQQQRAMLFLADGSTITSSLRTD